LKGKGGKNEQHRQPTICIIFSVPDLFAAVKMPQRRAGAKREKKERWEKAFSELNDPGTEKERRKGKRKCRARWTCTYIRSAFPRHAPDGWGRGGGDVREGGKGSHSILEVSLFPRKNLKRKGKTEGEERNSTTVISASKLFLSSKNGGFAGGGGNLACTGDLKKGGVGVLGGCWGSTGGGKGKGGRGRPPAWLPCYALAQWEKKE